MLVMIAGSGGMLGSAMAEAATAIGHHIVGVGRDKLLVDQPHMVMGLVAEVRPDFLINCAADTDVEGAEREQDRAFAVNALLPGLLATACRRVGGRMVHFSSTGCYGAWKNEPYTEEDPLQPTTVHHRSKAAGEVAVREVGCDHLILRTGWLYGGSIAQPKNFVWRRLQEAQSTPRLSSDPSQRGVPTFIGDVARQTLALLGVGIVGTYNCTAQGSASRFEYVSRIVQASGLPCVVEPAPAGQFTRRAPVSPNEAAVNRRLGLLGLDTMPMWNEALSGYVARLLAEKAMATGESETKGVP